MENLALGVLLFEIIGFLLMIIMLLKIALEAYKESKDYAKRIKKDRWDD